MGRLVLDLPQETIDILNQVALDARDSRFNDAKGMFELRIKLEIGERIMSQRLAAERKKVELELGE